MIGRTISHYRIAERLGSGGMGVVYRAWDERLERDVAIKFLPAGLLSDEAARKRFHQEALTLARLQHPNIGAIYEFGSEDGSDFLVLECVPGTTLAERLRLGPMDEKEAIELAGQVAAALQDAHEHGVVHCDLKPANVLLTPKGQAKVLDFGLARLAHAAAEESSTPTIDEPAGMPGTLPYMAPEQLLGRPADSRTDIHALGALLYEMVSGRRAFPETVIPRLAEAILRRKPRPLHSLARGISPELERIILKCLEKSPEDRYQSVKELRVDLRHCAAQRGAKREAASLRSGWRWPAALGAFLALSILAAVLLPRIARWSRAAFSPAAGPPIASLAVLPLESSPANPASRYFADGLTAAIANELGEIHGLRVISLGPTARYRSQREPVSRIARDLGVQALLVGSFRRSGSRVRLTYRLTRPSSGRHVWTHTYEFSLGHIEEARHHIAETIAGAARVHLTLAEQAHFAGHRTVDAATVESFLRGEALVAAGSEEALAQARAAFERAIVSDPDYAPAYAGLAEAYLSCACDKLTRAGIMARVKAAAIRALELDEGLAVAHSSLGFAHMAYDYDWPSAQRELKRAIQLNPSLADAHLRYGEYLVRSGRFAEGIAEARIAAGLGPFSPRMSASLGMAIFFARHTDAAIEQLEKTLRLDPASTATREGLGIAYLQAGRYEEAASQFQQAIALGNRVPELRARLAEVYARVGQTAAARRGALDLARRGAGDREAPAYALARVYAALKDDSTATDWLEKAFDARDPEISLLEVDPALDGLRGNPRFQALVHRAGIP